MSVMILLLLLKSMPGTGIKNVGFIVSMGLDSKVNIFVVCVFFNMLWWVDFGFRTVVRIL
ncbi:hypothetical protein GLYMA_15G156800v4 [Glycine max]|uniref:Uncharacterized protein n=1 Tax=Glycine max TaxID=3847 RepID=K7MBK3_SOYBN|nr:hypothetical protein JHK85_043112 [Glycine max]KAH1147354.1 hypothetical protein GYH30_042492 [Glycine max]KRH12171.1 hypothetical protein GLYMA_15G156800v4 [Glycine max]